MNRPALFLDRDGVLNADRGYVFRTEEFEPLDGVFEALRLAAAHGYALIVITNQSGIGRGYFSAADYAVLEEHMRRLFAEEGVMLTDIYHCPHHPDADCACRKPRPGMILRAAREHDIDLGRSIMVGDKPSDADAARAAGVATIELVTQERGLREIMAALLVQQT